VQMCPDLLLPSSLVLLVDGRTRQVSKLSYYYLFVVTDFSTNKKISINSPNLFNRRLVVLSS
jgi:hypothetical protein